MVDVALDGALSEPGFAAYVAALAESGRRDRFADLLREDHEVYAQRSAATVIRMRGWVLLMLARIGVTDSELLFVLEELDTGNDPYLVACAARALHAHAQPTPAFAPFVMRAIHNIRYRDEPVSFEEYGAYALSTDGTSPMHELLAVLSWLGPAAKAVLSELVSLRGLSKKWHTEIDRTIELIRAGDGAECCALPLPKSVLSWAFGARRKAESLGDIVLQDENGVDRDFGALFQGHPSIVVFFYTRCDNPQKCSLTITKLARIQQLLQERGFAERVHSAAITYDPDFDLPERMRAYAVNRGVALDARHHMLRATSGADTLRRHFELGVNFVESLVNRHRIEVFILDADGRISAFFQRIHWDVREVVDRAIQVCEEIAHQSDPPPVSQLDGGAASSMLGLLSSIGIAFFPKCPVCWAAYLSMLGIAGVEQIPYSPWLQPLMIGILMVNLASVWQRGRQTGRFVAFYLVAAGAFALIALRLALGWELAGVCGIALTFAGSALTAFEHRNAFRTSAGPAVEN
jgi:protein SCO1/2